jgi:hypothetical protein
MKRSILGVLLVLTFVAVGIAAAPSLTFTFSDVHATKTATETDTYGVNNAGTIAGDYIDSAGVEHGMILAGKKLTTVDNKNCSSGTLSFFGINSADVVVGWCTSTKTGLNEGFSYAKGKFTAVNVPKSNGTEPTGINDKGEIVGLYLDSTNASHGFSLIGKKFTTIDVKGDTNTVAWGVNNAGQITVYATNSAGDYDSYLLTGKKFKNIDKPNAKGGIGTIVHTPSPSSGDIDGTYYASTGDEHGWLLHKGKYYDVADPNGPNASRADGLNDKLEIVGRYTDSSSGDTVGYKVTTKQ